MFIFPLIHFFFLCIFYRHQTITIRLWIQMTWWKFMQSLHGVKKQWQGIDTCETVCGSASIVIGTNAVILWLSSNNWLNMYDKNRWWKFIKIISQTNCLFHFSFYFSHRHNRHTQPWSEILNPTQWGCVCIHSSMSKLFSNLFHIPHQILLSFIVSWFVCSNQIVALKAQ